MADDNVTTEMVREAVFAPNAEVIEARTAAEDPRGPAALVLGWCKDGRPMHILFRMDPPFRIHTLYDPSADTKGLWESDFKTRRAPTGGP
jgi:hypothetical protein